MAKLTKKATVDSRIARRLKADGSLAVPAAIAMAEKVSIERVLAVMAKLVAQRKAATAKASRA
jgi:hypothetical protein